MNEIKEYTGKVFEDIKHIDEEGNEYWFARELMPLLGYSKWERFTNAINNAKTSCVKSGYDINDHFPEVGKMVQIGSKTSRKLVDYKLSRYACYLIVQNGDSRKEAIALGQTYFAIQTRKQELSEKEYNELTEDEKRLYQRNLTRKGNYSLNIAAKNAGVKNFDKFHNSGYKGLYNGETANDIAKRKKLRYREDILEKYDLKDIDFLKVGHHGSKTSSSERFIDVINPKYAIISVGKNNWYGHPNQEVLNTLEQSRIYRTDLDGSIMFKIKNKQLIVETAVS